MRDATVIDPDTIRAVLYGNGWHAVEVGSARVERLLLDGQTDYADDWLRFRSDGVAGSVTPVTRIRLTSVDAFSTVERRTDG